MPTYMKACYVVAMLVLAGATTGCVNMGGWQTVRGSGNIATETRNVSAFDRVSVAGAGELTLAQGEEESLTIISGSGRVEYRGNPRVTSHVSGSGRVRRLDGKL